GFLNYAALLPSVVRALYFGVSLDHAPNPKNPPADPAVARHTAMPTEFQRSQSASFGITTNAALIKSSEACGSSPGSCGSPPVVVAPFRTKPNCSVRSFVAASRNFSASSRRTQGSDSRGVVVGSPPNQP